jgi:hypothetical protein
MKRRDFFKGIGGAATSAGMSLLAGGCQAAGPYDHLEDTDPRAGFNLVPPRLFLFLDRRYIDPGELIWRHPEGEILDLYKPEGKPVEARSDPDITPRGLLRIEAMPPGLLAAENRGSSSTSTAPHKNGTKPWCIAT